MTCTCGRQKILVAGAIWCPACDQEAPLTAQVANLIPDSQRWNTYNEREFIQRLIATGNTTALRGLLRAYSMRWIWKAPGMEIDRESCEKMIRGALQT